MFVSSFLHFMTSQHESASFKISLRFADDNSWLAAKNLKDQKSEIIKKKFPL